MQQQQQQKQQHCKVPSPKKEVFCLFTFRITNAHEWIAKKLLVYNDILESQGPFFSEGISLHLLGKLLKSNLMIIFSVKNNVPSGSWTFITFPFFGILKEQEKLSSYWIRAVN